MRRAFLLLALIGGCDRCESCREKAKAYMTEPPIEEYRQEVEEQIPTASKQATTMCGFPVVGLRDAKVAVAQESPKRFRVEGVPIPKNDAGIDKQRAAMCIGVVSVVAWPIVGEDNKVTGFRWDPVVLESVATPGVTWTKPSSGGGGWD